MSWSVAVAIAATSIDAQCTCSVASARMRRFRPPRLPRTLFSWIIPVVTLSDEKFAACAGFDALAYMQALRLICRMAIYISCITLVMVSPTNLSGSFVEKRIARQIYVGFDAEECGSSNGDTETNLGV